MGSRCLEQRHFLGKSCIPVQCFREFIVARLLLRRQNCAPARSFLKFKCSRCFEMRHFDKSWSPVRCFRQFTSARLLLWRQNCAPARSFLQFMGLRCFEIRHNLWKVCFPGDAFDNFQVLGLSWLLGAWALEFCVLLSTSVLIINRR